MGRQHGMTRLHGRSVPLQGCRRRLGQYSSQIVNADCRSVAQQYSPPRGPGRGANRRESRYRHNIVQSIRPSERTWPRVRSGRASQAKPDWAAVGQGSAAHSSARSACDIRHGAPAGAPVLMLSVCGAMGLGAQRDSGVCLAGNRPAP